MSNHQLMRELQLDAETKIVLLILDGLGGMGMETGGPSELEAANTPNMDKLASEGTLGQIIPIRRGITPGSGPAHLSLFGYDPLQFDVQRGVLEAAGVGMEISGKVVAARGNFCTVDDQGNITDRRAGRISSEAAIPIVDRLKPIDLPGVKVEVKHLREYRFAVTIEGDDLEADIADTDPQMVGVSPLAAEAREPGSQKTADLFNQWIAQAREILKDEEQANALTLRGFSKDPHLPQFPEIYGLQAACIAVYPMYRGVSRLVGMHVHDFTGESPKDEFNAVTSIWDNFSFFFIHIKKTDSKGEDGDFEGKVAVIETVDAALPSLLALEPDVLAITGDHSTPAKLKTHSWHPVPLLLWAPSRTRQDAQEKFGERYCAVGGLGTFPAFEMMQLLMANAGRLAKYGA